MTIPIQKPCSKPCNIALNILCNHSPLAEARAWVTDFVACYNLEHRHSSIHFVTPEQRHSGQDQAILNVRKATYSAAKETNPTRWSKSIRNREWQAEVFLKLDKPSTQPANRATNSVH
jgi:putative transposase